MTSTPKRKHDDVEIVEESQQYNDTQIDDDFPETQPLSPLSPFDKDLPIRFWVDPETQAAEEARPPTDDESAIASGERSVNVNAGGEGSVSVNAGSRHAEGVVALRASAGSVSASSIHAERVGTLRASAGSVSANAGSNHVEGAELRASAASVGPSAKAGPNHVEGAELRASAASRASDTARTCLVCETEMPLKPKRTGLATTWAEMKMCDSWQKWRSCLGESSRLLDEVILSLYH